MEMLIEININWQEPNKCGTIKGYAGKWHLFSISYNSIDRQKEKYILTTRLPGIIERLFFSSIEIAQKKADRILIHWLSRVNEKKECENGKGNKLV